MIATNVYVNQSGKNAQIEIKDPAHSIVISPSLGAGSPPLTNELHVKIELVSTTRPNQVLVDMHFVELKEVIRPMFKGIKAMNLIPLALSDNLVLSSDNKILITLSWKTANVTSLTYVVNTLKTNTYVPLVVKQVDLTKGRTIDTEYFTALRLNDEVNGIETIVDGSKIYQDKDLLWSTISDSNDVLVKVDPNQKITIEGSDYAYLIQY
ncbi:hypothetical protein BFF93_09030 [Elizabethkingia meningoseptica]|uniref:hypothetical protein n=1 Tax=Elizabethkingia meningoseptica TaxID=238 RepID=UPI00084128E9|nr:hypothetical protein [Elizabethkingia meningoseptica]ODM54323.1 hypothetical protein BES09_09025 [Elizabethkingia meningoseptica]OHT29548.1 hypothetical protein BFF93_09030 [Elizabethkingia meningoseptica]